MHLSGRFKKVHLGIFTWAWYLDIDFKSSFFFLSMFKFSRKQYWLLSFPLSEHLVPFHDVCLSLFIFCTTQAQQKAALSVVNLQNDWFTPSQKQYLFCFTLFHMIIFTSARQHCEISLHNVLSEISAPRFFPGQVTASPDQVMVETQAVIVYLYIDLKIQNSPLNYVPSSSTLCSKHIKRNCILKNCILLFI